MAREYRIFFVDVDNLYLDEADGYMALVQAVRLSPTYGKIAVKERHGSRWYTIAEGVDGRLLCKGKQKDYYVLPTDQYGQPTGDVETRPMTKAEAIRLEHTHGYVYDKYASAMYRAMA